MENNKKILLGVSAVAAIYGAAYMLKLNRLSNELDAVTKVSVHKVSLAGVELRIAVTLKNPSGGTVKVKQPFVKLIYNSTVIASSQIKNVNITIPKFSEVNLDPLKMNISYLTLATTAPGLLKEYRSTGKLNLIVKTITTINDTLPFTKTDAIVLGGGKQA